MAKSSEVVRCTVQTKALIKEILKMNKTYKSDADVVNEAIRLMHMRENGELVDNALQYDVLLKTSLEGVDKHLSSIMSRTRLDTSILLVMFLDFMKMFMKDKYTEEELLRKYRPIALEYYKDKRKKDEEGDE